MATVSAIVTAMATALNKLAWIDTVSTDDFVPAVTVSSVACMIVPFEQETAVTLDSLDADAAVMVHRITVEFWVKHAQGQAAITMQKARDAGTLAIIQLMADDGTGYVLARDVTFAERIEPAFVTHANTPWLIASLVVPIENEVTI
jgi:hypothetical protein